MKYDKKENTIILKINKKETHHKPTILLNDPILGLPKEMMDNNQIYIGDCDVGNILNTTNYGINTYPIDGSCLIGGSSMISSSMISSNPIAGSSMISSNPTTNRMINNDSKYIWKNSYVESKNNNNKICIDDDKCVILNYKK